MVKILIVKLLKKLNIFRLRMQQINTPEVKAIDKKI